MLNGVERRSACLAGNNVTSRDLLALSSPSFSPTECYFYYGVFYFSIDYLFYTSTLLLYSNTLL